MGFIQSILSGVLTKSLGKLWDKIWAWGERLFKKKELVERAEKYGEDTTKRVLVLDELKALAEQEIIKSTIRDAETGEVLKIGKVSNETKEKIRRAGRILIRGPREPGRS